MGHKAMGANDPQGVACLDPRGLIGRIYEGDHYTLLHTIYISRGPHGFRKKDFFKFFQDLCRGPLNIATYYIYKLLVSWFQRRFFKFFPL